MDYKDLIIPKLNVNDEKVTIENIRFNNLDFIQKGDVLYTVSSSKSTDDYESDFSGYIVFYIKEGGEVKIGESAGIIFIDKSKAEHKLKEMDLKVETIPENISKKALEYAKSIGFDLSLIKKDGIIKVQDIEDYLAK